MPKHFRYVKDPKTNEAYIETSIMGKALLTLPQLNKGTAFTPEERQEFQLLGKLPYRVESIEEQIERAHLQYMNFSDNLHKNIYLQALHENNQTLFYALLDRYLEEMLPIVYTPTVADAVQTYSHEYRRPRGLYISYPDRHLIPEILRHRTNPEIDIIVTSDAEGVLGIGDQGIGGMCIPVAKLMVYTLCAGLNPTRHLPIFLDVGTNNQALLDDPMYLGWRHERLSGEAYDEMIGLFVEAVKKEFPKVFLHWEDFGRDNARRNLERFQNELCTFNDDMQGTAAVTLSAVMSGAMAADLDFKDQRIVIFGAGTAGVGIADQIYDALCRAGLSPEEARRRFWLIDRPGLLVDDMAKLMPFQQPYARPRSEVKDWFKLVDGSIDLGEVIRQVKPTTLIGSSTVHGAFNESIVKSMAAGTKRPIILPLSNPTHLAEANPNDLLRWTNGQALVATGSPFKEVSYQGQKREIAQCNNALVFPGIGLGIVATHAERLTGNMLTAACLALSRHAPVHRDKSAPLLPPISEAKAVSFGVAKAVAEQAIKDGVAQMPEKGIDQAIKDTQWQPKYLPYRLRTV